MESHNFLTADQMLSVLNRVQAQYGGEAEPAAPTLAVRPGVPTAESAEAPEAIGGLTPELPEVVARKVVAAFDRVHGGLGGTPKFHHADVLEFVLAMAHRSGDQELGTVVARSLEAMAQGGSMIASGVASSGMRPLPTGALPHYEKMLGDQAQLLGLYLRAYQATGRQAYLETAQGVLRYIDSVLWDRERGTFSGSQEADPAYYALDAQGRAARQAPYVDRTVYTERNAAAASAYLLAGAVLNEPRYADLAVRALDLVWQKSYQEGLGMHHYYDTRAHLPGLLVDQVAMAGAWLDAFEHFGREVYLQRAETLDAFCSKRPRRRGRPLL